MTYVKVAAALAMMGMAAQPLAAAELAGDQQSRVGAFGGIRVQLPLGARGAQAAASAGLAFGPVHQSRSSNGASRTRFGEGLQLGFGGGERTPRLTLAGTRVDRLGMAQNGRAPDGRPRAGVSTLGWVGIGAGVVVLALGGAALWFAEAIDCDPDEECS